ncbi:MAG: zinc-finger domain-containing protein [Alphaproteobacteria bacterium]|nr:zinc-finger domain-containing protein [Alphaproteobacteria bacterium]
MQAPETIEVENLNVGCDGGGGPLGHPMVYLSLEAKGEVDCPYCGRRYVLKRGAKAAGGH